MLCVIMGISAKLDTNTIRSLVGYSNFYVLNRPIRFLTILQFSLPFSIFSKFCICFFLIVCLRSIVLETSYCSTFSTRFDATLDDMLYYKWSPSITTSTALQSSSPRHSSSSSSIAFSPDYCLPVEEAVPLLAQIFEAIAELELSGVAHRDLKPSNVLIRSRFSRPNITGALNGKCPLERHPPFLLAYVTFNVEI
uniref:Protein kinase domain n=1 Tax=Schistocephalus solidus TaxID=70667 RepID=A0A0V0J8V6_SCHSO